MRQREKKIGGLRCPRVVGMTMLLNSHSGRSFIPLLQPLPRINLPKALAAREVYQDYHAVNRMELGENLLTFPETRKLTAQGERSNDLAMELLFVA